eukprot:32586-Rhodomonas_salina.1
MALGKRGLKAEAFWLVRAIIAICLVRAAIRLVCAGIGAVWAHTVGAVDPPHRPQLGLVAPYAVLVPGIAYRPRRLIAAAYTPKSNTRNRTPGTNCTEIVISRI